MNAHPTSRPAKIAVLTWITALLLAGTSPLRAAEPAAAAPKPAAPAPRLFGGLVAESVHTVALVEKINYETREVTLKVEGQDGGGRVITAGPEVKRLAEIHKGDLIEIVYAEAVAVLAGDPTGAPAREDTMELRRADKATAPGGAVLATTRVLATVEALDPKARKVTLKGPQRTVTIQVDPGAEKFNQVKVGDSVYIEFIRAIAASVVKSAPAK